MRVESVLDVALADDIEVADDVNCAIAEDVVLLVRECLTWAITIESPVCTPIGSKFSMLQTVMQLFAASRTTSYSTSFLVK